MASMSSLSSLCYLSQNPSPLSFTTKAIFLHPKTNEVRRVPIFRVSSKMVFPNLQADDYRHPLDLEGIRLYKSQPDSSAEMEESFKDVVARFLAVGAFPSEKVEDDGTSVLAGPTQHSDTYKLMSETAEILNITTPLLYIRRHDVPLARAVGLDTPYVVVHSSLLKLLTPQELQAVFAHELADLKCGHYVLLKLAALTVIAARIMPDLVPQQITLKELLSWRQASDLSCDRASLLVAQDPKVVISAIMKVAAGFPSMVEERDVDAYLAAARAYVAASSSFPTERCGDALDALAREPVPLLRAYEIDEWSRSKEYAMLLTTATTPGKQMKKTNLEALIKKKIIENLSEQIDLGKKKMMEKFLEQIDLEKVMRGVKIN
uniref:uncharacterized protein LOC105352706 n=1 Tax=Fragaria vesca subsp. vesca TaxID=101020 RepID=UPI0005C82E5B|nr:PREDICTED: uncharacterized protein LOC105352706 [Fragaria vesca subsp. vesca]